MKIKQIMLVTLMLIAILTVGAVSAAEEIAVSETQTVSSTDTDIIAKSNEHIEEIQGESQETAQSFEKLNDIISKNSSSEIRLEHDYTYNSSSDSGFKNGIKITRDITIDGNNHTLNGAKTARIFTIEAGNVIFKNINFINGNGNKYGGAIYGNAKVENCRFINVTSTQYGGSIYGDCNISNSYFINSSAKYDGGAICGNSQVFDSYFENNNAKYNGGAISGGTVTNCTFISNNVNQKGGAVYNTLAKDSTFISNKAGQYGGALYNATAINCIFTGNYAKNNGGAVYGSARNSTFKSNKADLNGGAVYNGSAENCIFIQNTAKNQGGATYNTSATDCNFSLNSAKYGGAIYLGSAEGCNFEMNSATLHGGAIYSADAFKCDFRNNTAFEGAAIYNGNANDSAFTNNRASERAGAVYNGTVINSLLIANSAYFMGAVFGNAINSTFTNNTATFNGAMSGDAMNCTFANNSARESNGALSGNAINCIFKFNHAKESNGALSGTATDSKFINNYARVGGAMGGGETAYALRCEFTNNTADFGGAIYEINVDNSRFIENRATEEGGAIYKGTSYNSTFERNSAKNGGALYESSATGCTFNYNNAKDYGGAMLGGEASVDCIFNNNTAVDGNETHSTTFFATFKTFKDLNDTINSNNSSDIYLDDDYTFNKAIDYLFERGIIINRAVTIHGNGHTLNGTDSAIIFNVENENTLFTDIIITNSIASAIYGKCLAVNCTFERNKGAMELGDAVNCTFIKNTGNYGGAMRYGNAENCIFIENDAGATYGGAICYSNATNCIFIKNGADYGGAMANSSAVNCTFIKNIGGNGGVAHGRNCSAINCTFKDNKATNVGGVFYGPSFYIINCNFTNNSAKRGGAIYRGYLELIYVNEANLIGAKDKNTVSNCIFTNNSATENGGALYGKGYTVKNSTFIGNHAQNQGGASYIVPVTESKFYRNTADEGGAIYSATVTNSIFEYNNATKGGAVSETLAYNCTFNYNHAPNGGAAYNSKVSRSSKFNKNTVNDTFNTTFFDSGASSTFTALHSIIENTNETDIFLDCDYVYDLEADENFKEGISISREVTIHGNGHSINGLGIVRIFNAANANITLRDMTLTDGMTTGYGGAIWGPCRAVNCTFIENKASTGGATYNVLVDNCTFIKNYATRGGAVCGDATNSIFISNHALFQAGALYSGSAVNCTFRLNYADIGGAIGNSYAINCSFTDNYASLGGAMHGNFGKCVAINCNFTNNSANGEYSDGGAICNGDAITCIFTKNTAERNGGAISGGDANNCTFISNFAENIAGAMYGNNNTAFECIFIENIANEYPATYGVNLVNCTLIDNNVINKTKLHAEDLTTTYRSGEKLIVNLTDIWGNQVDGVNITIRIYSNSEDLLQTVYCQSNDGWIVNITEGFYIVRMSVENQDIDPISTYLTVKKTPTHISTSFENITYSQAFVIHITCDANGEGVIRIDDDIDNEYFVAIYANKTSQISIPDIGAGTHSFSATLIAEDETYANSVVFDNFSVSPKETSVSIKDGNYTNAENAVVTVIASEDGNIRLSLLNITKNIAVVANSETQIDLGVLKRGSYVITANFTAGSNYINSSDVRTIKVMNKINDEEINITVGEDIEIRLPDDATGKITLTINSRDYEFEVENGNVNVRLPELEDGNYTYEIAYSGDGKYAPFIKNGSVKINNTPVENKTKPAIEIPQINNENTTIILPKDATGTVTVTINNQNYTFNVTNGKSDIKLPQLEDGNYTYTITYSGDGKYEAFTTTSEIQISNPKPVTYQPVITARNVKVTYNSGSYYSVTVNGTDGRIAGNVSVVFKVNGKTFKTVLTNEKGIAKFKVTQIPKTYNIQVTALGESVIKKLTVNHIVTLKKVTVKKSAKKLILQATLKKVNGKYLKNKKVTFKFNGKKYTSKTSSKGVAKVTIKSNVLKKFKVGKKVTYQATYLKDTVKKTVKVKK